MSRLVRAGLLTGFIDGLWALVLTTVYQGSIQRLWQRIAATPFGDTMYDGGALTIGLGVLLHFAVAFTWSAIFILVVDRSAWLRRLLASPNGIAKVSVVYGPMIWVVMSAVVVPFFTHQPLNVTYRWWIQLAGHAVFVGLPIVWGVTRTPRRA